MIIDCRKIVGILSSLNTIRISSELSNTKTYSQLLDIEHQFRSALELLESVFPVSIQTARKYIRVIATSKKTQAMINRNDTLPEKLTLSKLKTAGQQGAVLILGSKKGLTHQTEERIKQKLNCSNFDVLEYDFEIRPIRSFHQGWKEWSWMIVRSKDHNP